MQPYGGFWRRVLAYFIDYVILNIAVSVISGVMGLGIGMSMMTLGSGRDFIYSTALLMGILLSTVLNWLYFALMESSQMQATVGKLALGVVVTDLHGNRISFLRATARFWAKILSVMTLLIGFILVGFTPRKQGLHDMIAGTLVWKTRDPRSLVSHEEIFR